MYDEHSNKHVRMRVRVTHRVELERGSSGPCQPTNLSQQKRSQEESQMALSSLHAMMHHQVACSVAVSIPSPPQTPPWTKIPTNSTVALCGGHSPLLLCHRSGNSHGTSPYAGDFSVVAVLGRNPATARGSSGQFRRPHGGENFRKFHRGLCGGYILLLCHRGGNSHGTSPYAEWR
jgi:hypothetical protein